MDLRKKLAISIIAGYLFIEIFLLCGLFTNEWIKKKEYHLGLRLYCYDTEHDTSCQKVVDKLPNLKYMLDTVFYLSIGACSWVCLVIIVMLFSLFCNGCKGSKTCRCTSFVMFAWCMIQGAALTIFVTAIMSELSASVSDVGWSLYLECTTLCISWFLLITQVITWCCCKDDSCRDSATVDVIDEIPRFKQPPTDQSVSVGNDITIHAIVENANSVIWNKGNDRVIKFSTCHREGFNETNGHATLSITKARFQDDGMYVCIAEKYGKITKQVRHEIRLYVLPVKPEFLKKLVDTSVNIGESFDLEAEVRPSESVTSVTWLHEGEDVTSSKGNRKLLLRDGKLIFKISNATVKDSGKYSCEAKSKGTSSHEEESISHCHVTVLDALSSAIENVLGDEQVIEGRAPMNHIMHDPNAVYQ
ncbi:titin-like isoform X1 [Mytilus californianus]|uniref:titin-like isoform X1 n=1 Tax=Mytilus californianus TaxID=6549 RepID=UPI002247D7B0|nr:titin-like isoform X1 [Mytilus californianus]